MKHSLYRQDAKRNGKALNRQDAKDAKEAERGLQGETKGPSSLSLLSFRWRSCAFANGSYSWEPK